MEILILFPLSSSSVIENVIESCESGPSPPGYAYVFFDRTMAHSEILDYNKFMRSLIAQLSDRCADTLPTALMEMYHACDEGHRQPLESQLEGTLARILDTFGRTYIIIDSVDECVNKADLLKWIQYVTSEPSLAEKIHLMLTSRPEPEVEQGLASLTNRQKVSITAESTAGDIGVYLDTRLQVSKMNKWDNDAKMSIKKAIFGRFDGM